MGNKISVITPSFNQGQYIKQTIESIWQQEGDFIIEHIIADGGSKDETVKVIKELKSNLDSGKYKINCKGIELNWWSKKDNGQAAAINEGLKKATGDIVCWLNSDDFYEPGTLKKVFEFFKNHNDVDFIYGDMNFTDINGEVIKKCDYLIDFNFWRLQNSCYICQPSTFWRKKVISDVGLLNENYHYAFDYEYWLRIGMCKDLKIKRVNLGVLSNLRTYKSRKTESGMEKPWKEIVKIFKSKKLYFNLGIFQAYYFIIKYSFKFKR